MYRPIAALLALPLLAAMASAQPPVREPVTEGAMERLVLDDGTDTEAAAWVVAEAALTVDKKHVSRGDTALRLHIDVNWETGEEKYPIGWPRMYRNLAEPLQAWAQYEYLEFSIFTASSRTKLPAQPLGFIIKGKDGKAVYTRQLDDLKLGDWVHYRLPLADLPVQAGVGGVQFYISESQYKHGDALDFWIDGISLVRLTQPALAEMQLTEQVLLGGARYLTVDLTVLGMKPDAKVDLVWELGNNGHSGVTGKLTAARGKSRYYLALPEKLAPGSYDLVFKCGAESSPPYRLLVTSNPWQEGSK